MARSGASGTQSKQVKLLLDTHIILWSLVEPRRLVPRLRRILERSTSELWLSPMSAWELSLLIESGRVRTDKPFDQWLAGAITALSLQEAPLTLDVILASREVTLPHGDPADRLLAASARYYDLRLVTADERLLSGAGFSKLANR